MKQSSDLATQRNDCVLCSSFHTRSAGASSGVEMSILILCAVYAALLLTIQNAVHSLNVLEGEFSDVRLRKTYVRSPSIGPGP